MIASRPVTTVIAVALLALGAVSGAETSVSVRHSAVVADTVPQDSGWGSTKPPVSLAGSHTVTPSHDSGWGSTKPPVSLAGSHTVTTSGDSGWGRWITPSGPAESVVRTAAPRAI
ncbi:hypothetical protein ACFV1A_00250 [Streptomyces seoulensis]|uniref:hypothetical protein n=1 Tax=Streptomyces seoulensis TaxID=73044 RepID=UPI000A784538|nr:hypothetical protein [Streptomyces seoulensis]